MEKEGDTFTVHTRRRGDCTGKFLRQIVTSAADGAVAAEASARYVNELEQIRSILNQDSGKTAFLFYNPYHSQEREGHGAGKETAGGL